MTRRNIPLPDWSPELANLLKVGKDTNGQVAVKLVRMIHSLKIAEMLLDTNWNSQETFFPLPTPACLKLEQYGAQNYTVYQEDQGYQVMRQIQALCICLQYHKILVARPDILTGELSSQPIQMCGAVRFIQEQLLKDSVFQYGGDTMWKMLQDNVMN